MRFMIGSLFGTKKELVEDLLQRGMVMVHLDARLDGVDVPAAHRHDFHLRLNLSLNFDIDDFDIDDVGIRASLSFRGVRHLCVLPWHAVFAITSHVEPLGYLWPDDLPLELATQLGPVTDREVPAAPERPRLRIVRGAGGGGEVDVVEDVEAVERIPAQPQPELPQSERPSHLRLVK